MVVKILLAFFAFVTGILGVSDLKTVKEAPKGEVGPPWWRRLTTWGLIKIFFVASTFSLIALNEHLGNKANEIASQQARVLRQNIDNLTEQYDKQTKTLNKTQAALSGLFGEATNSRRSFDLMMRSMGGNYSNFGTYAARLRKQGRVSMDVTAKTGARYMPKRADRISWRINCILNAIPKLDACPAGSYGYLIANGEKQPLSQTEGTYTFRGTRSTGGSMTYEGPTGDCRNLRYELQNNNCDIVLSVDRTLEHITMEIMEKEGFKFAGTPGNPLTSDLCRAYEILHGQSCEKYLSENFPTQ